MYSAKRGRGALHTKGVCSLGKLNYYLGRKAEEGGRSAPYPDVDFCTNPEAICSDGRTMEMRWVVALFEWVDRVQSYDGGEGGDGWNYAAEVTKFATEADLLAGVEFETPSHFIDEVGGILEQGCPFPPCDRVRPQRLRLHKERKKQFVKALEGIGLPVKSDAFRETEAHLVKWKQEIEDDILRSRSPVDGKMYQSYRYHFPDFLVALRKMSEVGHGSSRFYIGQKADGTRNENSGMFNIALFLTYAVEMSVLDDACDEHNTQVVNGRYPVSNSCGQYGRSYQDMVCDGGSGGGSGGMECPLDPAQSFSAVTRALDDRAPQTFKCAPRSQFPVTGYWDAARIEEDHRTAFASEIGRTNVENW